MNALTVSHVQKYFDNGYVRTHVLRDISLRAHPGNVYMIKGPSGSGKTTLLSIIGGLLTPTSGIVQINGRDIASLSEHKRTALRRHDIGFVFQSFHLLKNLNVRENVLYPGQMAKAWRWDGKARAQELLAQVGLAAKEKNYPRELSGGEQQRVAIARALINNPTLMLADEPTGNLDSATSRDIATTFANLAHNLQKTVLIVSHDQHIESIADQVITMRDGKIAYAQ
jgi:ABC-type lipoprotein export system ATPase subunit